MTQLQTPSPAPAAARPISTAPSAPPGPAAAPLSPEHHRQWQAAQQGARKIRRAVSVARFGGWTVGFFAAPTLLFGLFHLPSLLLGLALGAVAYNEFAGAKLLTRLDLRAPRRLALNQLGFCGVLIVYALWNIYTAMTGPLSQTAELLNDPQVAAMLGPIGNLQTTITLAVYGGLIVGTLIFQGGTAWYYHSRARHLRAYISNTPQWILDLQRTGGAP